MNAETYARYLSDRQKLIDYLLLKVREEDWHGVSDAANDIRVMDATYSADKLLVSL